MNMHKMIFHLRNKEFTQVTVIGFFIDLSLASNKSLLQEICDLKAVVNARSQVAAETKN